MRKKSIFSIVLFLVLILVSFGFFLGRESVERQLDYIQKQEIELLGSKQGSKHKSILELVVDVDKKLEILIKEIPNYFPRYSKLEEEYLSERQKLVNENEKILGEIKNLESQFLREKDLQAKVDIGTEIVGKFVKMGEVNSKVIEVDDARFLNIYKYTNFLYRKIEDLLLAYGYEIDKP